MTNWRITKVLIKIIVSVFMLMIMGRNFLKINLYMQISAAFKVNNFYKINVYEVRFLEINVVEEYLIILKCETIFIITYVFPGILDVVIC